MSNATLNQQCKKFLPGQYPESPQEFFKKLAEYTKADEAADSYGQGKGIAEFEKEIAALLGKEAAVFMPSGVMAQQIALRIWADQTGIKNVAYHPTCHIEREENKTLQVLHGINSTVVGNQYKLLTIADLDTIAEPVSSLLLELPQRRIGGLLPEWEELEEFRNWATEREVFMHLDGARLWEAQPFYDKSYSEICDLFDSVYVSFYKGLGGINGAMLLGDEGFIKEAKVWQRRMGGNLHKQFPYVLNAKQVFENRLSKMKAYHEKAKELAMVLNEFEAIEIKPSIPQANMFHLFIKGDLEALIAARNKVAKEQGLWLFNGLVATQVPGYYNAEIAIGDAGLDLSPDELRSALKLFFEA